MKRLILLSLSVLLLCAPAVLAQQGKKKGEDPTRSVQGSVTMPDEKTVSGAVVYLKNSKTLQIRTFITKEDGTYYFHGLSPDIDYELRAEVKEMASSARTLSAFDSRREAVINLKLAKK